MKTIDLFCASPASTAICSSTDQRSMIRHVTRPIGRHGKTLLPIPCQSQLPIDPKPHYQKNRKSTSSNKQSDFHRKSSVGENDLNSPSGSSRYLLSDTPFFDDVLSDSDHVKPLAHSPRSRTGHRSPYDSPSSVYSPRVRESDHFKLLAPSHKMRPGHLSSPKSSPRGRDSDHAKTVVPSYKVTPGHPSSLKSSSRGRDLDHVKTMVPSQKMRAGDLISTDSPLSKSSSSRSCPRDKVFFLFLFLFFVFRRLYFTFCSKKKHRGFSICDFLLFSGCRIEGINTLQGL